MSFPLGFFGGFICAKAKEEECSRNPRPKLLKEIQEAKKHIVLLQEKLSKATAGIQVLEKHTRTHEHTHTHTHCICT